MTRRSCKVLNINKLPVLTTIKGLRRKFYGSKGILQDVITSFFNVKILLKIKQYGDDARFICGLKNFPLIFFFSKK